MMATVVPRRPLACYPTDVARVLIALACLIITQQPLCAVPPEDAHWIWSPDHKISAVPAGTCYFRKTFSLGRPEFGKLQVAADDRYKIYVNGRMVGAGRGWQPLKDYDISRYLTRGQNVIAIRVTNNEPGDAGLMVRAVVKDSGGTHVSHATDNSWKTSVVESPHWMKPSLDDRLWPAAQSFGRFGVAAPWHSATQVARKERPVASPPVTQGEPTQLANRAARVSPPQKEPPQKGSPQTAASQKSLPTKSPLLKSPLLKNQPPAVAKQPAQAPPLMPKVVTTPSVIRLELGQPETAAIRFAPSRKTVPQTKSPPPKKSPVEVETDQPLVAGPTGRFKTPAEFEVEWVLSPKLTGSLIAMTFNEFGQIIASREGGPLILITDKDKDGIHESVAIYCDLIKSCQGMLAINGALLAVGEGPQGVALYRLSDEDRDGRAEKVDVVLKFQGDMGEHGPHAVTLGPDGLIYVVVGNHAVVDRPFDPGSPHHDFYEGDLVQPRYEDPGGHAVGKKVPAGIVIRTDMTGSFVELVVGGLRNPYDFAFNRQGDLFTYDADMEWDLGTSWYRPTRINHLTAGAEFGWRSGWAKWPDYYLDSLPAVLDMGPGSPTGVTFYDHFMYPVRYQGAMFLGDWALGNINVVRLKRSGGTYTASTQVFVEGRPLNITDLEVGPDGWLYFCTGGRGTSGGIYRVVWTRNVPAEVADMGTGITQAIRQPQFNSAWARQRIAAIQSDLGDRWQGELTEIAGNARHHTKHRLRSLDLMQLFGPKPSGTLLSELGQDTDSDVRAKVAYLMGLREDGVTLEALERLLSDEHAAVRRQVCESLTRRGDLPAADRLLPLLADTDRFVAYAARRALERRPVGEWRDEVLTTNKTRIFLQGATALLVAHPSDEVAHRILDRARRFLGSKIDDPKYPSGFLSDENFTDLMRVIQLALLRGKLAPEDVPELRRQLAQEYPSADAIMNRELVRLLAYLKETSINGRIVEQLRSDLPLADKLHLAMHAPHFALGWTTENKLQWLVFYEQARQVKGGISVPGYIDQVSRDFFEHLSESERRLVLSDGVKWPNSALAVLARLPKKLDDDALDQLLKLDKQLEGREGKSFDRLRVGTVAVLARDGSPAATAYLRELFVRAPKRRTAVAMGLAQQPDSENWHVLIQAVPVLEDTVAREVISRLATVDRRPEQPEPLRQVILAGLRSQEKVGPAAVQLLAHWTGEQLSQADDSPVVSLSAWQKWFAENHPNHWPAELPVDSPTSKWTYQELLKFLESDDGSKGDVDRGTVVFKQAECVKCHRYGNIGERIGPDLTAASMRFQQKEILESILFPSQVISDQYASQKVLTTDGRVLEGIVAPAGPDSLFVLQQDGKKVEVLLSDVEEQSASRQSAMPAGLLDKLTLKEIADLFAFMRHRPRTATTNRRGAIGR